MKKEYKALQYRAYIKRLVVLWIIPWIIPVVYLLTKEKNEPFQWWTILFPIIFVIVATAIISFSRKVFLGNITAFGLDFHTAYELDKRNEKHKVYNLQLLANVYFYDGEFQKAIDCSEEILCTSSNLADIYMARHQKILSLFLESKTQDILELIKKQRKIATDNELYYSFIEDYLSGQYESAIQSIQKILEEKNIEVQNHKKVLVNYFMLLAFQKMNDGEQVQNCINEILCADKNSRTFFSKSLVKDSVMP